MITTRWRTLTGVAVLALALWSSGAAPPPGHAAADIVLPKGTTFGTFVERISRAARTPVIAHAVDRELVLAREVRGENVPEALTSASAELSYHWMASAQGISLVHRDWLPEEQLPVQVGEAREIADHLARIIFPMEAYPGSVGVTTDRRAFVAGLSGDQRRAMLGDGLPLSGLTEEERRIWTKLSVQHAFGARSETARKLAAIAAHWPRCTLSREETGPPERRELHWFFQYPADGRMGKDDRGEEGNYQPIPLRPTPTSGGEHVGRSTGELVAYRRLKLDRISGKLSLSALLSRIADRTRKPVSAPNYATEREYLLGSPDGASVEWVLHTLCSLEGWIPNIGPRRITLSLPRPTISRDPLIAYSEMRTAVPPRYQMALDDRPETSTSAVLRARQRKAVLMQGLDQVKGPAWKQAQMSELSPELERRAMAWCIMGYLHQVLGWNFRDPPPAWLSRPETGLLRLSGPGPRARISIEVPNGPGTVDFWGWYIGSSSDDAR